MSLSRQTPFCALAACEHLCVTFMQPKLVNECSKLLIIKGAFYINTHIHAYTFIYICTHTYAYAMLTRIKTRLEEVKGDAVFTYSCNNGTHRCGHLCSFMTWHHSWKKPVNNVLQNSIDSRAWPRN